jgi:chemotaxis protein methyltransferase CheR
MGLAEQELSYLRGLVYEKSAIVIEPRQDYLLEARLLPVAKEAGLADVSALVGQLRAKPANGNALQTKVIEAMTTNETTFFRDIHPFTMLKQNVFPQLLESRKVSKFLNIWCGAASTGQESYSVAMLVKESFPELASWRVRFVATDICSAVLERAREGIYKQIETNRGLPAPLLVKYFERHGADFRIREDIRKMIEFRQLNLIGSWNIVGPLDIVFLRNVLIYFDVPTKKQILGRVFDLLAPDGLLFLGGAETTLNLDDRFERVQVDKSVAYKPKK